MITLDKDATFIVTGNALFHTEAPVRGRYGPSSTEKFDPAMGLGNIAYWGSSNLRPQEVLEWVRKSDLLRPLIHKHARRMIGQGIAYGTIAIDERTGEERRKPLRVLEIDQALRRTRASQFLYETLVDYNTHGNAFVELQTDMEGRVVGLYNQDAARVRLAKKDKNGLSTYCVISGKWAMGAGEDAIGNVKLPCLDPYFDVAGQVKRSNKGRLVLPLRILHEDNDYYADAPWHGLIDGGYLKLAEAIIKTKLWLTINLSMIRYQVEVGEEFWPLAFPGWKEMKPEEKKKHKEDLAKSMGDWLTGQEKAGRVLITDMLIGDINGNAGVQLKEYRSLWKVNAFKLDIPTGAYVEDSAEVDAKIIRAFMDQSLFGNTPSKDRNSSGSGSDKRVAHSIEVLDNAVEMELLMTPLDVMADTHDWHKRYGNGQLIRFWTKTHSPTTLDKTLGGVEKPQA